MIRRTADAYYVKKGIKGPTSIALRLLGAAQLAMPPEEDCSFAHGPLAQEERYGE